MTILNYFFTGFILTFIIELLFLKFVTHPLLKGTKWSWAERIICVVIWPIGVIVFLVAFIKQFIKTIFRK